MTPEELEMRLIKETEIAESHKSAWEKVILPFFESYDKHLFECFQSTPTRDSEALQLIKLQTIVANNLKNEILHFIETGEFAKQQLAELHTDRGLH